ncbi:MAG TPA: hypothetical protein VF678_00570, partial [bacterium]
PMRVPFACTITKLRVNPDIGSVVAKGQVLFEVRPDVPPVADDPAARAKVRGERTKAILARL